MSHIPGHQALLWGQRCSEAGTSACGPEDWHVMTFLGADVPEMGWDRILSHGQRLERPWEKGIKANKELMMALVDGHQFWDMYIKKSSRKGYERLI